MTIRRFEEIASWVEARELAGKVYRISNQGKFASDFGLRDQIRKASVSIMANIAEGFGRGSKADFIRFLWISHASALETQSHLYIALDLGYLARMEFDTLYGKATEVARMIGGFIHYLSRDGERKNQRTKEPKN